MIPMNAMFRAFKVHLTPPVLCHVSHIVCDVLHVILFFWTMIEACRGTVGYQWDCLSSYFFHLLIRGYNIKVKSHNINKQTTNKPVNFRTDNPCH